MTVSFTIHADILSKAEQQQSNLQKELSNMCTINYSSHSTVGFNVTRCWRWIDPERSVYSCSVIKLNSWI